MTFNLSDEDWGMLAGELRMSSDGARAFYQLSRILYGCKYEPHEIRELVTDAHRSIHQAESKWRTELQRLTVERDEYRDQLQRIGRRVITDFFKDGDHMEYGADRKRRHSQ